MADPATTEAPKAEAPVASEGKPVDKPEPEPKSEPSETAPAAAPAETSTEPAPAVKDETAIEPVKDEASVEPVKDEAAVDSAKERELAAEEKEDELAEEADSKPAAPVDDAAAASAKDVDKEAAPQPKKTSLDEFDAKLPEIIKEVGHDEMWGVKLVSPASSHVPTGIVLQKFLNANDGNLAQAIDQFKGALNFRKDKKPLELLAKKFSANKFADLGAVTVYTVKNSAVPEVFTWNLYGNVKGKMDEVFVPLDEYVKFPQRLPRRALGS